MANCSWRPSLVHIRLHHKKHYDEWDLRYAIERLQIIQPTHWGELVSAVKAKLSFSTFVERLDKYV